MSRVANRNRIIRFLQVSRGIPLENKKDIQYLPIFYEKYENMF